MHNDTASVQNTHHIHDHEELTGDNSLHAIAVPDEERLDFWPQHFGTIPQWITLEPRIFGWMDRLCDDYYGGIWRYHTLSNGGAFMVPEAYDDSDGTWTLFNSMNGNGAELSSEAAGIVACLMAYSHHSMRTECDAMIEHYYSLRDYGLNHAECNGIMHLID
ncbi:antirestriction protein [Lelliottia aquatilis]|uniref:antirestriction protein n=1 Tax=Lelliottia aquatilis TaxID=2080838 RepID=UPI00192AEDBC|nr:antirestriction protein [Lelliottia aquatilis]MBL5883697.1 antirestriction protein [Lelliottia aquatilis]